MIIWTKKKQQALINFSRLCYKIGLQNWSYTEQSIPTVLEHITYIWRGRKSVNWYPNKDDVQFGPMFTYYDGYNYAFRIGPIVLESIY